MGVDMKWGAVRSARVSAPRMRVDTTCIRTFGVDARYERENPVVRVRDRLPANRDTVRTRDICGRLKQVGRRLTNATVRRWQILQRRRRIERESLSGQTHSGERGTEVPVDGPRADRVRDHYLQHRVRSGAQFSKLVTCISLASP